MFLRAKWADNGAENNVWNWYWLDSGQDTGEGAGSWPSLPAPASPSHPATAQSSRHDSNQAGLNIGVQTSSPLLELYDNDLSMASSLVDQLFGKIRTTATFI